MGQGLLRTYRYAYPNRLYNFLKEYKYDDKFHSLKQLGAIQYFFKGAHHTRYEYIFLQWTLIHELCTRSKGSGLSSKINRKHNSLIMGKNKSPTPAELLQCLAILTNMGHFPVTFSASKVWLHLINKNSKGIRTTLKKGLNEKSKKLLNKIFDENDYYNIHLINSLFLLERYRRRDIGNEIIDFSINLINEYLNPQIEELKQYWSVYRSIRKMSYLLLDSNYAPIPFKMDFSSIMLTLDNYETSIINSESVFYETLNRINNLLEKTLYLAPNIILISKLKGDKIIKRFENNSKKEISKLAEIRALLSPHIYENDLSSIFDSQNKSSNEVDWDTENFLDISYNRIDKYKNLLKYDMRELEQNFQIELGEATCRVGAMFPPSRNNIRLIFSIKNRYRYKEAKALDIIRKVIKFDNLLTTEGYEKDKQSHIEFKASLFEYLLKYSFNTDFVIEFDYNHGDKIPFFIGAGSKTVSKRMYEYIEDIKSLLSDDEVHELMTTALKVENLNYRGTIMSYLGGTKLRKKTGSKYICEFDGLICLPNRKKEGFLYIIEAKNKVKGEAEAQKQLDENMKKYLSSNLYYSVNKFSKRDAYAEISLKN